MKKRFYNLTEAAERLNYSRTRIRKVIDTYGIRVDQRPNGASNEWRISEQTLAAISDKLGKQVLTDPNQKQKTLLSMFDTSEMSGDEMKQLRSEISDAIGFSVSQADLEPLLDHQQSTLSIYETGVRPIPKSTALLMRLIHEEILRRVYMAQDLDDL